MDGRLTLYFPVTKFFLRFICDIMVCLVFSGRRRVSLEDLNEGNRFKIPFSVRLNGL